MATNQRTTQKFEVIEYQGKPARLYEDGTIRGEHGHFITQTSQRARELHRRRKEQGTQIARDAIRKYTSSETFAEGLDKLVAARVEVAMTDKGRAGNDAFTKLLILAGAYTPNQPNEPRHVENNTAIVNLSPELRAYIDKMSSVLGEVIEHDAE